MNRNETPLALPIGEKFWLSLTSHHFQMPTRHLHIPNVRYTHYFSLSNSLHSLVPAAAPKICETPLSALSVTASFPVSKFCREGLNISPTNGPHLLRMTARMQTNILAVEPQGLGSVVVKETTKDLIDEWEIEYAEGNHHKNLKRAAEELVKTDTPVAFPTETVYGLGADATRSSAVKAIFAAKGRPADNPLIVHIHSLPQLRALLLGKEISTNGTVDAETDPIPAIYRPVIERFWPGPITIILPAPNNSILAPEVTAGLPTFGARMPRSILALSLLRLCGRPLAAPSANASTRPSPTAAEHVYDDLKGRIRTIIDGGPCEVGVESTVVDGLSSPPSILRPGGVTVEQLRQCPGWEKVVIGYKDSQEGDTSKPRAPGMKYRHYSPKARVILFEAGAGRPSVEELNKMKKVGFIRTISWPPVPGFELLQRSLPSANACSNGIPVANPSISTHAALSPRQSNLLRSVIQHQIPCAEHYVSARSSLDVWDINLGAETEGVARGLFSALRELDKKEVDIIYVEGINDKSGDDIAAAVMNRLRKAAEIRQ